ncbi:MAG: beta-propeller fold lactonase family protein [Fimbriimonas sp.]|nr:beta-propeller fold lactonase family protein [Fimbriimonas sp.]
MRRILGSGRVWIACCLFGGLAMMANAQGPRLYVVNQGDKTMSVVDPTTNRQISVIDEHQTTMHGHEIAVGPDGHTVFMPIYGSTGVGSPGLDGSEMLAIDGRSGQITGRVQFGHGVRPHCVVYEPSKKLLYVTTELDQAVTVVDPVSLVVIGEVPTGAEQSHMLAITRDGKRGYTSNVHPGSVSVLDLEGRKTVAVIPVADVSQRIALSRDDRWAFTSDQTQPRMAVIDTSTNKIVRWIDLPGNGYGPATTPNGRWLLVPIPGKDLVAVVDVKAMVVARSIPVDRSPQEMLVRPDGKFAYVAGASANKVSVIDLKQWKTVASIGVGSYPDGLAWAN